MQLAIDRGNTQTKVSTWEAGVLSPITYISDAALTDALPKFIALHKPERAIVSDVRSSEETASLRSMLAIPFMVLEPLTTLPIEIRYSTPQTLGRDRIANAVGALKRFGNANLLVIDCGSCMTYTLLQKGALIGGSIAPGIDMRFKALHDYTGGLPQIALPIAWNDELVGTDTQGSIESGVLSGIIQETEGMIERYRKLFPQLIVIITGGNTSFFEKHLKSSIFAAPYLTHEGLHEILRQHCA